MVTEADTVSGIYEAGEAGNGFLRNLNNDIAVKQDDVLVPKGLSRQLSLRGGEFVTGTFRSAGKNRRNPRRELQDAQEIDGLSVDDHADKTPFEKLTPIDPDQQVHFEMKDGSPSMRVVDLLTPIGFGQRGLIVAPPRTGKTMLLQQMAKAVAANHPNAHLMVLLIDERPEEATDMRRNTSGEVFASTTDKDLQTHIRLSRLVTERAKRLVEQGRDVFMILDSLTRVGRAFNAGIRGSGRIMSGGLDTRALIEPKSIFGAARNVENGGSLTIVASALIETGSRMDEVIFNEFKGTGNMEIVLSREMANRRIWPAIDLNLSGTRKEELLLSEPALNLSYSIRRTMADAGPIRSMEQVLAFLLKHPTNEALLAAQPQTEDHRTSFRRRR